MAGNQQTSPGLGDYLAAAFPQLSQSMHNVGAEAQAAANAGDYARAAGAVTSGVVRYPVAAVQDVAAPLTQAVYHAPSFLAGLTGMPVPKQSAPAPAVPAPAPASAAQAAAAGPAKKQLTVNDLTPAQLRDMQAAYYLQHGLPVQQLAQVGSLVPQAVTDPAKLIKGQAGAIVQQQLQTDVKNAGNDQDKVNTAFNKALEKLIQIGGGDPLKQAIAAAGQE